MTEPTEFTYETWVEKQDEIVKEGINKHYEGLLNSVKATRSERDELSKELKKLSKEVEANSEAGKLLGELQAKLSASEKKSNFIELAAKQGIKRPSAAYAIAISENLFTEEGEPDFEKIREAVPELFTVQSIKSDAGSGTNQKPEASFNSNIRSYLSKKHKR
jgi:hypothetical protein